ncbi:MAG: AMP-binding protein, partial [Acidimicrobiia bacterium]
MDLGTMAGRFPDREAVVTDRRRVTYAELDRAANRLAHRLRAAGLRRGDVLAVCAGNGIGTFEAYWAAMRLGLYFVPVNRHLRAAEIGVILADVATLGSVATVADDGTGAAVDEAAATAGLERADHVSVEDGPVAAGFPDHRPDDAWEGQLLLYSSGTSGRPKGVLRDLPDLRPGQGPTQGLELAEGFGVGAGDRYLSPGPLHHSAPLAFATACQRVGATAVVMTRFDPAAALDLLASEAITVSQWVPTMFVRLLGMPDGQRARAFPAHRLAFHAAAPCPVAVKRAMIDWWGPILVEYYSGTEGGRTMIDSAGWLARPGS